MVDVPIKIIESFIHIRNLVGVVMLLIAPSVASLLPRTDGRVRVFYLIDVLLDMCLLNSSLILWVHKHDWHLNHGLGFLEFRRELRSCGWFLGLGFSCLLFDFFLFFLRNELLFRVLLVELRRSEKLGLLLFRGVGRWSLQSL